MNADFHKVKIGNQTNKPLIVVPNNLEAKYILPQNYMDWDSYPLKVDAHVYARDRRRQLLDLGNFKYDNLVHNYADIHIHESTMVSSKEGKEYYTLYDYVEGDTIHPFNCVEKAVWDCLPDRPDIDALESQIHRGTHEGQHGRSGRIYISPTAATPYDTAIEAARKSRAEFIASLTEAERTTFLLRLLSDLNDPTPIPESFEVRSPARAQQNTFGLLPPSVSSSTIPGVGVKLDQAAAWEKGLRQRCGCDQVEACSSARNGQSYIAVDYNYGVGRGRYDITVYVNRYGSAFYGTDSNAWDLSMNTPAAYKLWQSGRLVGPGLTHQISQ